MLALTRKSEYGLIAMCHLARSKERVVSAREIAVQHGIPLPLLMNVLKTLCQRGLVRSLRGARGGYSLAQAPRETSLAALIEAIEGPLRLMRCAGSPGEEDSGCDMASLCHVRGPLQRVHEQLVKFLSGVSLAEIAFDERFAELRPPQPGVRVIAQ